MRLRFSYYFLNFFFNKLAETGYPAFSYSKTMFIESDISFVNRANFNCALEIEPCDFLKVFLRLWPFRPHYLITLITFSYMKNVYIEVRFHLYTEHILNKEIRHINSTRFFG